MDSIPSFVSLRFPPTFYIRIFSPSRCTGPTHSFRCFISQPKHRFSFQCIEYCGLAVSTAIAPEKSRFEFYTKEPLQLSHNFQHSLRQTLKIVEEKLPEILETSTIFSRGIVRIVSAYSRCEIPYQ